MTHFIPISPPGVLLPKAFLGLLIAAFLWSVPAFAADDSPGSSILRQKVTSAEPDDQIPIIVRMHDPDDIRHMAVPTRQKGVARARARTQLVERLRGRAAESRQPLHALLQRHGIRQTRELWLINGMAFEATPAQIEEIAVLPEVASVEFDQVIELPKVEPAQIVGPAEPNIDLINAPALWSLGYAGQGVTIAFMDSGVDAHHPDLEPRWRGGSNSWFDPNGEHPDMPTDLTGHGTQVAGLALGGDSGGTFIGAAPQANWIAVKIFNDSDFASFSAIHAGFQWLLDPDGDPLTDDAPDIVNNAWATPTRVGQCDPDSNDLEFQPDIQALRAFGIAVVFSAGNTGPDPDTSVPPANYPESFAVGSVGTFDSTTTVSDFSARGPSACDGTVYPEVVAPGFHLRTADLTAGGVIPNSYAVVAGTSYAAPHASGVMALLLDAFPDAPLTAIETALLQSATDLGSLGPDNNYGFGLIDAAAAFNYLDGQQNISVTDSILPETDHQLPFGDVNVGLQRDAAINVRNTGSLPLQLGAVDDAALSAPFTITGDGCSNLLLGSGASCAIEVRFAPSTAGSFTGSLAVVSNVVGQERITVEVTGVGVTDGTREIRVTDSILPATDGLLAFEQMEPGQSELASILVENIGSLPVGISSVDSAGLAPPFAVASDDCSGSQLAPGGSCRVVVRFAPTEAGEFAGSLDLLSDAENLPLVAFDLTGTGNSPPVPPEPLLPANGATVGTDVTFFWSPASDADGDRVEQFLVYDTDPDFGSPTEQPVNTIAATLLGSGGLLLGGLTASLRRRRKLAAILLVASLSLGVAACSGGGGGDGVDLPADAQSFTVQGLTTGTIYYWKLRAEDSRGAETESTVRSFMVQ